MNKSFDVFLSHNSKNKPAVRELAEALRARGLKVWLDEWELVPGQPWQEALEEVIEFTKASAVLVGKDGLGPWQDAEMRGCLNEFVHRELPVIPVLLPSAPEEPKLPLFLARLTWVDLRGGLTEEGIDRIQWGVTRKRPDRSKPLPTSTGNPEAVSATDPVSIFEGVTKPISGAILLAMLFKLMPNGPSPGKVLVWSLACAIASGGLWAGLVHLSQKGLLPVLRKSTGLFGGNGREPNGWESLIWTVIVFGPITCAAIYLTSEHRAGNPLASFLGFLVGTAVGAFAFYGGGVRAKFLKRNCPYFKRETWLGFWWAVLLAVPGFLGHEIGLVIHEGSDAISIPRMLTQMLLVIIVLWSAVTAFVAIVRGDEHENVRGMWAGGFLDLAFLSALLIVQPADLWSWLLKIVSPL